MKIVRRQNYDLSKNTSAIANELLTNIISRRRSCLTYVLREREREMSFFLLLEVQIQMVFGRRVIKPREVQPQNVFDTLIKHGKVFRRTINGNVQINKRKLEKEESLHYINSRSRYINTQVYLISVISKR